MTYALVVLQLSSQDLALEAYLNGVRVAQKLEGKPRIGQTKLNPWVVEGGNRLELFVGVPAEHEGLAADARCELTLFEVPWGERDAVPSPHAHFVWQRGPEPPPRVTKDWALGAPQEASVFRAVVSPRQTHGRWAWQDGRPFDKSDRTEVRALCMRVSDALVRRDADAMAELFAVKEAELARALDVPAADLAARSRAALEGSFADPSFGVTRAPPRRLLFLPRAGGRLLEVRGDDGGPPVAVSAFGATVPVDLTLSHLERGWTIVR
ncbi:MAG: hypothetical protein HY908_04085 [Myxococcales bacterium]|nr:hypothetical protein [Myxococcales bacterium]